MHLAIAFNPGTDMPQRGTEASYLRNRERQLHRKLFGKFKGNGSGEQLLSSSNRASADGTHPGLVLDDEELFNNDKPAGWWSRGVWYTAQQWAEWEADRQRQGDGVRPKEVEQLIEEAIGGFFPQQEDENKDAQKEGPKQGPKPKAMPKPRQPSTSPPRRPPATPLSAGRHFEMDGHKKHRKERRDSRARHDRRDRRASRSRERRNELRGVWQEDPRAASSSSSSRILRILSQTIVDLAQAGSR